MIGNEDVVGYSTDGSPIFASEFIADINLALKQFKEGTLETYTHEQVKQIILRSIKKLSLRV